MEITKIFKTLVEVVAFAAFSLQMILALQHYMEKPTMSSVGTKSLSALDKPLILAVCKQSQFDYSRASEMGYKYSISYLTGTTNNKTVLSWDGLDGNLTFNETFNYLYGSSMDDIDFLASNGTITHRTLLPYGLCKAYEGKIVKALQVNLRLSKEITEYFIFISDSATALPYQLPYSTLTGNRIRLTLHPNATTNKYVHYNVQLKETNIKTGDGSCVEYPTRTYESYADCVDAEMKEKILPVLGCMIPWISDNNTCLGPIHRMPKHESLLQWIYEIVDDAFGGIQYHSESCPLPCSTVSLHVTYLHSGDYVTNNIALYFAKKVKVETIVLAYDFTALLVEIGSCLGLWLGLSVVGFFDVLLQAIFHVKETALKNHQRLKEKTFPCCQHSQTS